jgi:uncharacterized protein YbcI
VLLLEVP